MPLNVHEMDVFYYDKNLKVMHEIIGIQRNESGLRYRVLPKSKAHLWPLVHRVKTCASFSEDDGEPDAVGPVEPPSSGCKARFLKQLSKVPMLMLMLVVLRSKEDLNVRPKLSRSHTFREQLRCCQYWP